MSKTGRLSISVVVVTRDRAALLRDCLQSLSVQTRPTLETLVVDNGSSDCTAAMVKREFPQARLILEPGRGVHLARNRGLAEARGEIVAFIDDDCLSPPGWLEAIASCFQEPDVACAGGPTRPLWPRPPSRFLSANRRLQFCLGIVDFGAERKRIDPDSEFLVGCNLAVRKALVAGGFRAVQSFRSLGVCGEDYELSRRLARQRRAFYEPAAHVFHRIQPHKMRLPYLLYRLFCFAVADAKLGGRLKPKRGPLELLSGEGAVSAVHALGHLCGRLQNSS